MPEVVFPKKKVISHQRRLFVNLFRDDQSNTGELFGDDQYNPRDLFRDDQSNLRELFRDDKFDPRELIWVALGRDEYQVHHTAWKVICVF